MKVSLNSLKQSVDVGASVEVLTERFAQLGFEVETVGRIPGAFDGIVVAQVVTREKHPNADKLSLCRVNDGQGERQIVCGAQNFQAGDKVPLILPGAALPLKPGETQPFTIKVGKIRGVESHGMLCSPQELGLPDQVDGLLILRPDAIVGQPFAEYLGRDNGDFEIELEVPTHRPDLKSLSGIAREIAVATGSPLKISETPASTGSEAVINLHHAKVDERLGEPIPIPTQLQLLQGAGLIPLTPPAASLEVTNFSLPVWRTDLKTETDLIEELGRLYGLHKISGAALPAAATPMSPPDQITALRLTLTTRNVIEAQGPTLVAKAESSAPNGAATASSAATEALRTNLLQGLLTMLRQSANRKNPEAQVFELGRVFPQTNGELQEERHLAIAMTGQKLKPLWPSEIPPAAEGLDLIALINVVLEQFGRGGVIVTKRPESSLIFAESAVLALAEGKPLGEAGLLQPAFAEKFNLRDPVYLAELNLDALTAGPQK